MYEHRDDIPPSPPDTEGGVDQRRLRWGLLAAVALVLLAAIPGILKSDGDTKKVTSAQDVAPSTTTTTGIGVVAGLPIAPAPATTTPAPSTTAPPQTSTTLGPPPPPAPAKSAPPPGPAKPCRNSYDPACGPFRWDPDPGPNAPLTVTVSPPSQQGIPGSPVNFHIVGHDPDAKIDRCYSVDFGDGQSGDTCPAPPSCQTPYGPWTPPGKVDDQYIFDISHRYATARAQPYVASFTLQSHSFCYPDPYGGSGQASAQVQVSAAP